MPRMISPRIATASATAFFRRQIGVSRRGMASVATIHTVVMMLSTTMEPP